MLHERFLHLTSTCASWIFNIFAMRKVELASTFCNNFWKTYLWHCYYATWDLSACKIKSFIHHWFNYEYILWVFFLSVRETSCNQIHACDINCLVQLATTIFSYKTSYMRSDEACNRAFNKTFYRLAINTPVLYISVAVTICHILDY